MPTTEPPVTSARIERLFTLGPEGTFSDRAARRAQAHLTSLGGAPPAIVFARTVAEVARLAATEPHSAGIMPIENSTIGTIVSNEEALKRHDVVIEWEVGVRVRFRLLANAPLGAVLRVYSHPAAYDQCGQFLSERLGNAQVVFALSNTDSGERFHAESPNGPVAAIVPIDYGSDGTDVTRFEDIQDDPSNTTRFVVFRRREEAAPFDFSRTKASLVVDPNADRSGLLHDVLAVFKRHHANLCRIESRPARTRPWEYVFHLDIHQNSRGREILSDLEAEGCTVRVLGTFDSLPDEPA